MSVQPIRPGAVVSEIWAIYLDQSWVLIGAALVLYALQFVIYLVLPSAAAFALAMLFWALSVLYQGMVVELVRDVQDGRRDQSIGQLIRSVQPGFWDDQKRAQELSKEKSGLEAAVANYRRERQKPLPRAVSTLRSERHRRTGHWTR